MTAIIPTKLILDPSPTLSGDLDANGKSISGVEQLSFRELLDDSLVGYWPFVASANDCSQFGNDGTLVGDAAIINGVLTLDGTGDWVNVGDNDRLNFTNTEFFDLDYKSTNVGVHQGVADDGEYLYTFASLYVQKRLRDTPWTVQTTMRLDTIKAAAADETFNACNHIGDGVAYGDYIYVECHHYIGNEGNTEQYILRLNKSDLTYSAHWDIASQDVKAAGIATDGTYLYANSYADGSKIWRYTMDGVFVDTIALSVNVNASNGITYSPLQKCFYIATMNATAAADGIRRVAMDGTVGDIVYTYVCDYTEGLDYSQDRMIFLEDNIAADSSFLHFLRRRESLDGFTISAWIRPTGVTSMQHLVSRYKMSGFYQYTMILTASAEIGIWAGTADGTTRISAYKSGVVANQWQHALVVADFSNNTITAYLDAVAGTSKAYTAKMWGLHQDTIIGACARPSSPYPFTGQMADVRMYNRPLSAAEIQKLYSLGVTQYPMARTVCYVTDPAAARPIGYGRVIWTTDTEPTNAIAGDVWIPTA